MARGDNLESRIKKRPVFTTAVADFQIVVRAAGLMKGDLAELAENLAILADINPTTMSRYLSDKKWSYVRGTPATFRLLRRLTSQQRADVIRATAYDPTQMAWKSKLVYLPDLGFGVVQERPERERTSLRVMLYPSKRIASVKYFPP